MKTMEEFIEKLAESEELRDELAVAGDEGAIAELLREHGVDGTVEELAEAIQAKAAAEGEIPDDDAGAVAGGRGCGRLSLNSPEEAAAYAHALIEKYKRAGLL